MALDREWRFTAFNRAAEQIFGLSRAQVIGRVLWDVSPNAVGTEFERRYRKVMSDRARGVRDLFGSTTRSVS